MTRVEAMSERASCICADPKHPRFKEFTDAWSRGEELADPDCKYHQQAAAAPMDHSIPWNCPTYWDGCNCRTEVRRLRSRVQELEDAGDALDSARGRDDALRARWQQAREAKP